MDVTRYFFVLFLDDLKIVIKILKSDTEDSL